VSSGSEAAPARWRITSGVQDPEAVRELLAALPGWFGIPESNHDYVQAARDLDTYRARDGAAGAPAAQPAGVLLARRHFPETAEIHLMAVHPRLHRAGAGRALVQALEADLVADGCELLQVKTLGPSHPDAGYALTRRFYASLGFMPVEELHGLWSPGNPCLLMVKPLRQPSGGTAFARTTLA
jgi:ribosomal protein S18 acetylase RimI-like enzyme